MLNLGYINSEPSITSKEFKKILGKNKRFSFLFSSDLERIIEMGRKFGECEPVAVELLWGYVPDLEGSMIDVTYDIIAYNGTCNGKGIVTIKVETSAEEFIFP